MYGQKNNIVFFLKANIFKFITIFTKNYQFTSVPKNQIKIVLHNELFLRIFFKILKYKFQVFA